MPEEVRVTFIGDPGPLFKTADEVNARLNMLGSTPTNSALSNINSQLVISEQKSVAAEAATKKLATATDNLTAAQKRNLEVARQLDAQRPTYGTSNYQRENNPLSVPASQSISDEQFRRGSQLRAANDFAEQDKRERARAFENSKVKLDIYRADKAAEVQLEEQTAGKIKQIRGFGAVGRALGLTAYGINESEINAGISFYNKYIDSAKAAKAASEAEAAAAIASAAAANEAQAAIFAGPAIAIGAAIAGLAIIYHITSDIKEAEATKLKLIEAQAIAYNNAIIAQKESLALANKASQDAAFTRDLNERIKSNDIDSLKARLALIVKLQSLSPAIKGEDLQQQQIHEQQQQERLALEARIAAIPQEKTDTANKSFDQRNEDYKKSQKQAIEFQKQQDDAAEAAAKKAEEQAKKLREVAERTFDSLTSKLNAGNPFAKIFTEADKAARELRENLSGLSTELQALATQMQQAITARELFNARLESVTAASDLRAEAKYFRSGTKAEGDKEYSDRLNKGIGDLGISTADLTNQQKADLLGTRSAQNVYNTNFGGSELNQRTIALAAYRRFDQQQGNQETPQEKLDRQFKALDTLKPGDQAQRDALDRKITSLAGSTDPTQLRQDTRNKVADSQERLADRAATQEAESIALRKQEILIQTKLLEVYNKQLGITDKGGKQPTESELKVTIQNNSNGKANATLTQPTPRDTELGYASGAGGLTNR